VAAILVAMSDRDIDQLLIQATALGASDLHLRVGAPPLMRLDSAIQPVPGRPVVASEDMEKLVGSILSDEHRKSFYENKAVDFAYAVPGVARFRVNFFLQRGRMGGVMRRIPETIPQLADLAAPKALLDFARKPRGLVLVTGPTGSGKSTTLASVIDVINTERQEHILTIEDPIEFVHPLRACLVNQREVGPDTPSFKRALRDALREDPDVILVGEMRDFETISIALTAAETGHLVFGTLHTSSAETTISRIIDVFPSNQQQQIRTMLASSLAGVVCQTLLPRADGQGRVAAHEVLVATTAVRSNIRENTLEQIRSHIQTGHQHGMQTLDRSLAYLVATNTVAEDVALEKAFDRREFNDMLTSLRQGRDVAIPQLVQHGQGASAATGSAQQMYAQPDAQTPVAGVDSQGSRLVPAAQDMPSAAGQVRMPPPEVPQQSGAPAEPAQSHRAAGAPQPMGGAMPEIPAPQPMGGAQPMPEIPAPMPQPATERHSRRPGRGRGRTPMSRLFKDDDLPFDDEG
jgi:twitching motility protein PilT